MGARKGNKSKDLLSPRMLFPLLNHLNCYTLICFVLPKTSSISGINITSMRSDHEENLKMKTFNSYVKIMGSFTIFQLQEHHIKMVLLRGKIGLSKKRP
ncbi:hypothetical protein CR513_01836, partial [Mucuna pruriens]